MNFLMTSLLGAIAGFTIYLGLPVARLKNLPRSALCFLNALAIGILVFLLWDILSQAIEPIDAALETARQGEPSGLAVLLSVFVAGLGVGLLGLVYFESRYIRRTIHGPLPQELKPAQLALIIAIGIGLHNFSEGLAIGQASRVGALSLATTLIVGFGLHNATEGFGIAAPLTGSQRPSWGFLALAGLIGGGPTFLGTLVGYSVQMDAVFVLCLALAAGSIFYVIVQLLNTGRRYQLPELAMWGVFLGFLAGYFTDLILTWAGA
jgi:ZIP family zinc transporter